jgi:hypothetical protein
VTTMPCSAPTGACDAASAVPHAIAANARKARSEMGRRNFMDSSLSFSVARHAAAADAERYPRDPQQNITRARFESSGRRSPIASMRTRAATSPVMVDVESDEASPVG